jgi:hypothetical protein
MDEREAPQSFSLDELIRIILELQVKAKRLEARGQRPPKTPDNSSLPLGQSRKGKKKPANRGLQEGHLGTSRTQGEPDVVIEQRVE